MYFTGFRVSDPKITVLKGVRMYQKNQCRLVGAVLWDRQGFGEVLCDISTCFSAGELPLPSLGWYLCFLPLRDQTWEYFNKFVPKSAPNL